MHLQVTHETCYDYAPAVAIAQHMVYLQPLDTAKQRVLAHSLQVTPQPVQQVSTRDVFGNTRTYLALQTAHTQLQVVARSVVSTRALPMPPSALSWEQVGARFQYGAKIPFDGAGGFVFASPFAPRGPAFEAYARPSFPPGRALLAGARDLMQRIHQDFSYETQSTQVNTPALQALAQRKGVCQDFAHIMIACLRALGLPARYVSGYLLTQCAPGQQRLVGADASHAWVSVYLPDLLASDPGACWCDFDPTNNRDGWGTPGEDYVTLAVARDFGDVSPVRGVIPGGTHHALKVGVTVEPVDAGHGPFESPHLPQSRSQSATWNAII